MMQRDVGDSSCPIWLLAESNPTRWQADLEAPLDPRHPARHSIWTSVADVVQDRVYRECGLRVETGALYIRNAVENSAWVQNQRGRLAWGDDVQREVEAFGQLLGRV